MRLWHVPVRLATGAFILDSGLRKLSTERHDDMHKHLHSMASAAYPQLEPLDAVTFTRLLGTSEVALGGALIAPVVSPWLAGAGLSIFSTALIGLYLRLPGMRQAGSVRPSGDGTALAKDSWMLAIGLALMTDAATTRLRRLASSSRAKLTRSK